MVEQVITVRLIANGLQVSEASIIPVDRWEDICIELPRGETFGHLADLRVEISRKWVDYDAR